MYVIQQLFRDEDDDAGELTFLRNTGMTIYPKEIFISDVKGTTGDALTVTHIEAAQKHFDLEAAEITIKALYKRYPRSFFAIVPLETDPL